MSEEKKKQPPKRPCKTCENPECSSAGDAYSQEFICTSFISGDELEQNEKREEYVEKLKEDLMGVWGGGFPF
jgi:hypothetical protein